MGCRAGKIGWLGVLVGWLAAGAGSAPAQTMKADPEPHAALPTVTATIAPAPVAVDEMPAAVRDRVRAVMEKPTLTTRGPTEVFTCRPAIYYWLVDNPDQAVHLWRLLGAKCTDIERETTGFCWHDEQGSKLHWDTVLRTGNLWFAVGFHIAFDFMQFFVVGTPNGERIPQGRMFDVTFDGPAWLTGGVLGTEASFLMYPLIAGIWLYVWWRFRGRPDFDPASP